MKATETRRTLIRITLTLEGRWAVGHQASADSEIKLPVLMDPRVPPQGVARPYLPATGLVGSLRRHLGSAALPWLGPEPGQHEATTGTQSSDAADRRGALQFLGTLPIDASIAARGVTAVEGGRGAAAVGSLRTEQWAEPGLATLVAVHQGERDAELMSALARWRPFVGRGRTAGLGRANVTGLLSATIDLADPAHLLWWLTGRDAWLCSTRDLPKGVAAKDDTLADDSPERKEADRPVLDLGFIVAERIHVGTGAQELLDGRQADSPMRSGQSSQTGASLRNLIVPGSSWKGIFRHRCETILRLAGATDAQLSSIVASLFGSPSLGRGMLTFGDTGAEATRTSVRRHVAIDRFTGGARDSALVTVLSIPEDQKLTLQIRSDGPLPTEARSLLLHVTRDLHDGLIGVGRHTTRGYGSVRLDKAGRHLVADLPPVDVAGLLAALTPPEEAEETTP